MPVITFLLNDRTVQTSVHPSTTLLDFIRYESNLKGTKIGCREGDCGACTVLIGTLQDKAVEYLSATSCLTPLANVAGKHVVTVEGLNLEDLNVAQEAMVRNSGTQCGFCTPGFVVSLCGYAIHSKSGDSPHHAIGSIDGNICRCTGYKSIERAATDVWNSLQAKDPDRPLEWLVEHRFLPSYFLDAAKGLSEIVVDRAPGEGLFIGGGTDLYVQRHDDMHEVPAIYLRNNTATQPIKRQGRTLVISGTATATDLADNSFLTQNIPGWYAYMKLVSSTPIRNIATVAGNLVNASPIGDLTIMLLAMDAQLTLTSTTGSRTVPLHLFYKGYKTMDKAPDEMVTEITFDLPEGTFFHFEKVCKRTYLDIASVNTALCISTDKNRIIKARASAGGVGPVPLFLKATSHYLEGKEVNPDTIKEAAKVMISEISPISDVRGSAQYKRGLLEHLFYAHFLELFPEQIKMEQLV